MTLKYRIGWDVGAWHCTRRSKSQDALVALEVIDGTPRIVGEPWRRNLSKHLHLVGDELLLQVLSLCGVSPTQSAEITIAIDTPLGWPSAMLTLAAGGAAANVPAKDEGNRYTRRQTEIDLAIEAGKAKRRGPLSAVRDRIGSQSTKGLHFLLAADLNEDTPGVWKGGGAKLAVTVIETYPAEAFRRDDRGLHANLIENLRQTDAPDNDAMKDVEDALMCAVVAHLYADVPDSTDPVPAVVPAGEGWIIVPKAVAAGRTP